MFLRFKQRKLKQNEDEYSLRLMLVESKRKKGKPRQKVLQYLGSIHSSDLSIPQRKKAFVASVYQRLDRAELTPKQTAQIKVNLIRLLLHQSRPHRYNP